MRLCAARATSDRSVRLSFPIAIGLWAAGLAFSAGGGETPASEAGLEMRAEATSAGDEVLLKDVCTVRGADAAEVRLLEQLGVSRAAIPGETRTVTRLDLETALERQFPALSARMSGAPWCRVKAQAQTISTEQITAEATRRVRELAARDSDLEVEPEVLTRPAAVLLRPGEFKFEAEPSDVDLRPGTHTVRLRLMSPDGRCLAEPAVSLRLRITGTVVYAAEHLSVGDVLQDSDLRPVRKELTVAEYQNRGDALKWNGMRVRRPIPAGDLVTRAALASPTLVKRGEPVTVYIRRGALELSARGEARADAARDEPVRILISDGGAEVVARACGVREVSLDSFSTQMGAK